MLGRVVVGDVECASPANRPRSAACRPPIRPVWLRATALWPAAAPRRDLLRQAPQTGSPAAPAHRGRARPARADRRRRIRRARAHRAITMTSLTPAGRSAAAPAASLATEHFRGGHPGIAGAEHLVALRDGLGAVGHGGDGLSAADLEYPLDARLARGDQHRGVGAAVRFGAVHMMRTGQPAIARRHRQHDGGGRQGRGARGHVQADRAHRHADALANHAGRGLDAQRRRAPAPRGIDAPSRWRLDRRMLRRRSSARSACANSASETGEPVQPDAVESLRQLVAARHRRRGAPHR